jgi:hypothetical protein
VDGCGASGRLDPGEKSKTESAPAPPIFSHAAVPLYRHGNRREGRSQKKLKKIAAVRLSNGAIAPASLSRV